MIPALHQEGVTGHVIQQAGNHPLGVFADLAPVVLIRIKGDIAGINPILANHHVLDPGCGFFKSYCRRLVRVGHGQEDTPQPGITSWNPAVVFRQLTLIARESSGKQTAGC